MYSNTVVNKFLEPKSLSLSSQSSQNHEYRWNKYGYVESNVHLDLLQ